MDMYRTDYQLSYLNDSVMIIKIVLTMMAIFLTGLANGEASNNLAKYVIDKPFKKYAFIIARVFSLILIMVTLLLLFWLTQVAIVKILTPFAVDINVIKTVFIGLLLQIFFYILFTSLLLTILPSLLTSLLPILVFWYMEVNNTLYIIENSNFNRALYQNIPNILFYDNCYNLLFPIKNYIISLTIIFLLNIFIYVKKDIS